MMKSIKNLNESFDKWLHLKLILLYDKNTVNIMKADNTNKTCNYEWFVNRIYKGKQNINDAVERN